MHICGYIYIYMIKYASHWFAAGLKGQIGLCLVMLRKKKVSHSTIKQRLNHVESTYLVLINDWSLIIFQFSPEISAKM